MKINAYVKEVTLRFGPLQTQGKLLPIKQPKSDAETDFKLCTPEGKAVKQAYIDENDKVYAHADLHRGRLVDGELVYVGTKDTVKEAKASELPLNVVNMTAHSPQEVDRHLFPSENQAYVFIADQKDPANVQQHAAILAMLHDVDAVFLSMVNLKHNEGLFKIFLYQGNIAIQKQLMPDSLNHFDEVNITAPDAVRDKLKAIVAANLQPFDPEGYELSSTAKLRALKESGALPEPTVREQVGSIDLMDMLENFDL